MKGYMKKRGDRYYAMIYEGRDPVTGKERRRWHPAGSDRAEAERLAAKLAAAETSRVDAVRSLTFGAYLTSQWLPAKKLHLATSTYRGYERNVARHILPALGRVSIRRLRYQQIEALYDTLLHPTEGKGLSPKTVYGLRLAAVHDGDRDVTEPTPTTVEPTDETTDVSVRLTLGFARRHQQFESVISRHAT